MNLKVGTRADWLWILFGFLAVSGSIMTGVLLLTYHHGQQAGCARTMNYLYDQLDVKRVDKDSIIEYCSTRVLKSKG